MDDNTQDDYFGVCPTCKQNDGYINVGRNHFFVCHEHRVKWCGGSNLFSSWRSETENEWTRNRELLSEYKDVDVYSSEVETTSVNTSEANGVHPEPSCLEQIPADIRRAVAEVVECLWDAELNHFVECARYDAAARVDESLFATLCKLRTYFEGQKHDPQFYLAKAADPNPFTDETLFVIDRIRNVAFDARSQEYQGKVVQTSVGRLRDATGKVIGVEVLHWCVGEDNREFGIETSIFD